MMAEKKNRDTARSEERGKNRIAINSSEGLERR
jgi:hypothetical protein